MKAAVLEPAAKPARLTRARRTALLKALADPRRFELLEKHRPRRLPAGLRAGPRRSAHLRRHAFAPHQGA